MSYSLYQVTWRVMQNGSSEQRISLHESKEDFITFLHKERKSHPTVHYATVKSEFIDHANGNLRNEVHKARLEGKYGIWKTADELSLA